VCSTEPSLIEKTLLARHCDVVLGVLQGSRAYQSHPEGDVHSSPGTALAPGVIHLSLHCATWHHASFGDAGLVHPVCNAMLMLVFSVVRFNTQQYTALCCAAQGW